MKELTELELTNLWKEIKKDFWEISPYKHKRWLKSLWKQRQIV